MNTNPQTACPHCNGSFAVHEEMLGQTVECPHCAKPVAFVEPGAVQTAMSAWETYNVVTAPGALP